LIKLGDIIKPIVGKCGANIPLIDQDQMILAEKLGMFDYRDRTYQQLFLLPYIDNLYVQVCTFMAQGIMPEITNVLTPQ
jgi:glutathionylspermidine amidase/synthetase